MSNKLGTFTQNNNGFSGKITTMTVSAEIIFQPNPNATSENGQPDFRVITPNGYDLGGAWKKMSKQTDREYLSVSLAAPELGPKPIWANLIALDEIGEDDVSHLLLWSTEATARVAA